MAYDEPTGEELTALLRTVPRAFPRFAAGAPRRWAWSDEGVDLDTRVEAMLSDLWLWLLTPRPVADGEDRRLRTLVERLAASGPGVRRLVEHSLPTDAGAVEQLKRVGGPGFASLAAEASTWTIDPAAERAAHEAARRALASERAFLGSLSIEPTDDGRSDALYSLLLEFEFWVREKAEPTRAARAVDRLCRAAAACAPLDELLETTVFSEPLPDAVARRLSPQARARHRRAVR